MGFAPVIPLPAHCPISAHSSSRLDRQISGLTVFTPHTFEPPSLRPLWEKRPIKDSAAIGSGKPVAERGV